MADLLNLVAKIGIDDKEYQKGIEGAQKKAGGLGNALKSGFKVAATAIAATTAAVVGLSTALVNGVKDTAAYGDNIDKMSQKMGMSAEAYQEWDAVMQHSGTSIDSLQAGMKTLANAVESGNEAFGRLGITQEQIASMNNEELFSATITALQNVDNETERTYLAGQLLGRGATELGALLNTSAEETQAMKDRVHELGGVMSDEAVKAAARFQDQLQDMQTSFAGIKRNLLGEFMPAITTVMGGLTEIFAGNTDEGMEQISEGVESLVNKISEIAPKALEIGTNIVLALAEAIVNNLPLLLNSGVDVLLTLSTGIISMLPQLLTVGLDVLLALVKGITENLPTLIPAAVAAVTQIALALTEPDTLVSLIEAALSLILALADGLIDAIPTLVGVLPELVENIVRAVIKLAPMLGQAAFELVLKLARGIITYYASVTSAVKELGGKIWNSFKEFIGNAKNWGKDLIQNFVNGIKEKFEAVKSEVGKLANLFTQLKHSTPTWGPLKDDDEWMPDMMDNFIGGIRKGIPSLKSAVDDVATTISGNITGVISGDASGVGGTTVIQNNHYSNPHTDYEVWKSGRELERTVKLIGVGAV